MGKLFLVYLDGRIYSCRFCRSHLANIEDLVSRAFHCRQGKAYLFNTVRESMMVWVFFFSGLLFMYNSKATHLGFHKCDKIGEAETLPRVNVSVGPQEDRMMTTGLHTVSDIHCNSCLQIVGWKYERAYEKSQKYKEGKFILERARMEGGDASDFYSEANPTSSDVDDA